MKRYSSDKMVQEFVCCLVRTGWLYKRGKKHGKLVGPKGKKQVLIIPCSPSDHKAVHQLRLHLKRLS